jgi:hypothetical protein
LLGNRGPRLSGLLQLLSGEWLLSPLLGWLSYHRLLSARLLLLTNRRLLATRSRQVAGSRRHSGVGRRRRDTLRPLLRFSTTVGEVEALGAHFGADTSLVDV